MIITEFRERGNRAALFDGIEEGGIRASSSYSSHEIDEQENERAIDGLQDRVSFLKKVSLITHESLFGQCLLVKLQYRISLLSSPEVYILVMGFKG